MTTPSDVSRAAPTLKCEKPATACSRARRAAAIRSWLEAANDPLEQADELTSNAPRGFEHRDVIERLRENTGGHVADARDPEDLDTHVSSNDRLGHGRHPDGVGANRSQVANLGWRFVARTTKRRVDTMWK